MTTRTPVTALTLSNKGRQTRQAIEDAARTLFSQRGFHGTTLSDITSAADRSPAAFYRYFADKEDLLAAMAESFLHDVVQPSWKGVRLPQSAQDVAFFTSAVSAYWEMFKRHIGIMVAVDQLAATDPRFAALQHEFRRFGMEIFAASVRCAHQQGYARDLVVDHTALALALLFEQFTTVCLRSDTGPLGVHMSDADAVAALSAIWRKTLYGSHDQE
jgi:AcrR family transcriptional regulator